MIMRTTSPFFFLLITASYRVAVDALQLQPLPVPKRDAGVSRRSFLLTPAAAAVTATGVIVGLPPPSLAAGPNGLSLNTAPSGLKWADARVGSGEPIKRGSTASIDYSMASTAGRFPQIYTTKDKGQPYRWTLGDGSTIEGIERAIVGNEKDGIPPMLPGGVRRVIVPSSLGYEKLMAGNVKCQDGVLGPIPPKDDVGAYQRWGQFYCNPRIPYQPDLVLDIKLYGKRTGQ